LPPLLLGCTVSYFSSSFAGKGNDIKVLFLQIDPVKRKNIHPSPLDPDVDGGAPPPLHPLMAWIRYNPSAGGKSLVANS
jgi:hypothetical protein